MKKILDTGDNVKVIFKVKDSKVVILGKILKKGKRTLSLKFFKKVVYNLKEKTKKIVDFTPAIKKVKIINGMKVIPWPYVFKPEIQSWDDGEY